MITIGETFFLSNHIHNSVSNNGIRPGIKEFKLTTTLERTRKDKVMLYEKGARSTAPFVIDRGVRAKNINCTDVCCTKLCNWVERVTFGLKKQMW